MTQPLATGPGAPAFNQDDPGTELLLYADPDEWARLVRLVVHYSQGRRLARRAAANVERLEREGDHAAAESAAHAAVTTLRHNHTNYPDLVADLVDVHGFGARQNAVDTVRHRTLRALALGFPAFAATCRQQADDRRPLAYRLPVPA